MFMIELPRSAGPVLRQRVDWVDVAKGIAMILVVLYHVGLVLVAKHLAPHEWLIVNNYVQPIRMPLFMLTSGLFAQQMIAMSWPVMLRTRVALLMYLYMLWLVIFWGVHNLLPYRIAHHGYAQFSNVIAGIYWPHSVLWYLYALSLYVIVAKAIARLPVASQLGFALAVTVADQYSHLPFAYNDLVEYFFYFMIGLHLRAAILDLGRRSTWALTAASTAGYCALHTVRGDVHIPALKVALSIVGVVAAVLLAAQLEGSAIGRGLHYIGQRTLPIFLMFDIFIAIVLDPFLRLPHFILLPHVVSPLVMAAVVIALTVITHQGLMRSRLTWLFELPPLPAVTTIANIRRPARRSIRIS